MQLKFTATYELVVLPDGTRRLLPVNLRSNTNWDRMAGKLFLMRSFLIGTLALVVLVLSNPTSPIAQQKKAPAPTRPLQLTRTTLRHEQRRFAYGGTFTLVGAPEGSITIEGWPRSEIDVRAEIQLRADTEQDLDLLAAVNGVVLDEDSNHIRVLSTGTHDKAYMRAAAKKFPKALLGLPWKIDYRIRVPVSTDLDINAGRGAVRLTDVEGNIRLSATEGDTSIKLLGGTFAAMIGKGKVDFNVPFRSWRGSGADIRVAAGEVNLELPPGFGGDLDAEILRSGQIVDLYGGLEARERQGITPQKIKVRAGAGGAFLQVTVGDGTINIKKQTIESKQ